MELKKLHISDKKQQILAYMNINSVEDLLSYYPFRYEYWQKKAISEWQNDDKVILDGVIISKASVMRLRGNTSMTRFKVSYEDDVFMISLFNRPWTSQFTISKKIVVMGKYQGNKRITALKYSFDDIGNFLKMLPVYHLRDGISQKDISKYIDKAYQLIASDIKEWIPLSYRSKYRLISKKEALYFIHHPSNEDALKQSLRYLKYEEFLRFQLTMQLLKQQEKKPLIHNRKLFDVESLWELKHSLAFELTIDQIKAIEDILNDLSKDKVMYRLIQGDVGCGKTLVACFGMYACVLAHKQAALFAPTEILAKQHYQTMIKLFKDFDIKIAVLYATLASNEKKAILEDLKNGNIDIIIGTHALFQASVEFYDLGMVVADEQHRFGVNQRKMMLSKGENVDFLLMSATPIPRSLAISLFGDMDVSTIVSLPANRKVIKTTYLKEKSMKKILPFVLNQIDLGHQCYVVCPAIEENQDIQMSSVNHIYQGMEKVLGSKYKIALLHGAMNTSEKDQVMADFVANKIDILVSTTVIEVGVDVPNANMMVIYDAHRFGLSQIHQLRGRVGRGSVQGYCFLLSDNKEEETIKRLEIAQKCHDGFTISKYDLLMRGPGDLLGTRQSGVPGFVLANVISDSNILEVSRSDASEIINDLDKYPNIKKQLELETKSLSYID